MKFKKEFLLEAIDDVVSHEIVDTGRWTITYCDIFEFEGAHYETCYEVGSTECQDQGPYEYDGDEIECPEVVLVEKTVKVWVRKDSL